MTDWPQQGCTHCRVPLKVPAASLDLWLALLAQGLNLWLGMLALHLRLGPQDLLTCVSGGGAMQVGGACVH